MACGLEAAWNAAVRHVVIQGLAGAVAFPRGVVSEQLEALPALAPQLTGCVVNEETEALIRRRVAAVGILVQDDPSGVPGLLTAPGLLQPLPAGGSTA